MSEEFASWFDSGERRATLLVHADHWIGTPFFANSCSRGPKGGVSCQKLASQLYAEAGFGRIAVPEVAMSHARFAQSSLVEEFMDGRSEFRRLLDLWTFRCGDLLGFRIRKIVHHVGIALSGTVFIHALEHIGTSYGNVSDPTWRKRLAAVWRPVGGNT